MFKKIQHHTDFFYYYKLFGVVRKRYNQVDNVVALPISRALGYAFGVAYLGRLMKSLSYLCPKIFP